MVGESYPLNLMELEAKFATEEACRAYLAELRWPAGFRCPGCGSEKAWPVRNLWECGKCGRQTSVIAGTIFQDTHIPLPVWFRAMISLLKRWLIGTHQGAISHKHLDYYLDEFTFRFNRRRSKSRGKLFFRLAQQAVSVDPVTYYGIVHSNPKKPKPQPVEAT
jgi:ribosomal protein L37AE/L43A